MTVKSSLGKVQEPKKEKKKIVPVAEKQAEEPKEPETTDPSTKEPPAVGDSIPEEEPSKQSEASLTIDEEQMGELEKRLLAKLEKRLIKQGWGRVTDDRGKLKPMSVSSKSEIDFDDVMDEPHIFFCYSRFHQMYGFTEKGVEITTPYGNPITFQPYRSYQKANIAGKGMDLIWVSRALIHSKIEAQWIRDHFEYGTKVFDSASDMQKVDITLQQKMSEVSAMVSKMNEHSIIVRCRAEKLHITEDFGEMKRSLIQHLANQEIEKAKLKDKLELEKSALVVSDNEGLNALRGDVGKRNEKALQPA